MHIKALGAIGAAAAIASFGLWTAQAAPDKPHAAADGQAPLVEDYSYPGAAEIQQKYHVILTSGDGHIVFADCTTPPVGNVGVLEVRSTENVGKDGLVCFKVLGSTGHLELRLPAVFEIRGDGRTSGAGHKMKADLTTDAGQHSTVDVAGYGSTPVGIGANPNNAPTTLLQLTVGA
ncbi:hypothetical protein [Amycolatopsis jejuensis]|uniref:hypothetical protein n=1 Tax=Amycolatopsis jejuensis TaxID=330084 RepID=UPI00068BA48B|nr:hypothetical protein [Amycolatopsis jejuensis]